MSGHQKIFIPCRISASKKLARLVPRSRLVFTDGERWRRRFCCCCLSQGGTDATLDCGLRRWPEVGFGDIIRWFPRSPFPVGRLPCKSLSRGNTVLLTRASEERARAHSSASTARTLCLSAVVPAFAEPDIHSLSQVPKDRHRRLSGCSLPVLKQFGESLGSLISLAQSANGRTWQSARCVILFVCSSPGSGF